MTGLAIYHTQIFERRCFVTVITFSSQRQNLPGQKTPLYTSMRAENNVTLFIHSRQLTIARHRNGIPSQISCKTEFH